MLNTFVKATKSLDISRNRHTNPILEVTIDMKLEIFINNLTLIFDLAPILTH
jgi:hypothetical protein